MTQELENLISLALADGQLTYKEKRVLFKKAEAQGVDMDEFEMVLDGRLHQIQKNQNQGKTNLSKCPICGDTINGLSKVCPSCNFILSKPTDNAELDKSIQLLEDSLVNLKSYSKPNYFKVIKSIVLIYFSSGIYILYKKFYKKEHLFSSDDSKNFDAKVALSEKHIRSVRNNYGENSKVKKLIEELTKERDEIVSQRKKIKQRGVFIVIGIFVIISIAIALQPKSNSERIEDLITTGKIDEAKSEVSKLKNDYEKENYQEKISEFEIEKLIEVNKFDDALQKASMMNSKYKRDEATEKIIAKQVDDLILQKDFKAAKQKAALIESEYKKTEVINKIDNAEKITK